MILIVDDKAENIFSLKKTLELNGFPVDDADSGEEALRKILKNDYSLIILDVQMPGMDGFEVAEALSGYSKAKDIPIIFLSAVNTEKRFITKGYTSGGVDYVTKPVDPDVFLLKVKTLHRLYEQNRELRNTRLSLMEEVETRKQAEDELNKKMQELRTVFEMMPQIAFTTNSKGEIDYVNEQWYLYSDNVKKLPQIHPTYAGIEEQWKNALLAGEEFVSEILIRHVITDEYRYHLLKIVPVKQGQEILKWVGTFTDIHEQKQANETLEAKVKERTQELVENNKELEASNHELQQFASVASHDLKEPLRKIQIFSSIIKERYLKESPDAQSNMNRIIESSGRMSGLIHDLLNYSRLSMDSLFQPTDLKQIIDEIISNLELTIKDKNALVITGDMPVIDAIPGQMRQVFQNLISNALKFSRADVQPIIRIEAEPLNEKDCPSPGNCYRISVSDNGIGFDEKYVEKIFTIFQRLNPKEQYEGTGIGLAIVKKIIDKHNGTITAKSEEGKGSVFIMMLAKNQYEDKEPLIPIAKTELEV